MKHIVAGVLLAASLWAGTVSAADLTLPEGIILPMGEDVSVHRGSDSFLAGQVEKWLRNPELEKNIAASLRKSEVFKGKDPSSADRLAKLSIQILEKSRLYQLQRDEGSVFYQALVLAIPLSDDEVAEANTLSREALGLTGKDGGSSHDGIDQVAQAYGPAIMGSVFADETLSWKEGTSEAGVPYRYASGPVQVEMSGMILHYYVTAMTFRDGSRTLFAAAVSEEPSGRYFAPLLQEALVKAVKGL